MHADATNFGSLSKAEGYDQLLLSLEGLLVDNWVANLANAASLLWYYFHSQPEPQSKVNWAGFYTKIPHKDLLVLGPFQGKVACQEIKVGSGVCGAAAQKLETQVVKDVHAFPGHIACDGDTNSEIVVPIVSPSGKCLGVIDVDCTSLNGFDEEDQKYLEKLADLLVPSLSKIE